MRDRKGLRVLIPFILATVLIMTGCAQEEAPGGVTDVTGAFALPEGETGEDAQTQASGEKSSEEASPATVTVSEISSASEEEGNRPKARNLSESECLELEKFINDTGNYGFLLSVYEKPQDLDAEQVFFEGAGLELRVPAEEEREAYLEETGEEMAVNLFRLGATQVNDYLQYRAGVSMDELSHKPDWVYLEDYDAYYLCHGDEETNVCDFEVTDAAVQGDFYRVHFRVRREAPDLDGWHIPVYEVILKKNGDSYRFCANRLWMENGLLLRPYCEFDTESFGKVRFCSYKPDRNAGEYADVTFSFVKASDVLFNLPGMSASNIRENMEFDDVKAVDLADYDGDGAKEIVTICEYQIGKEGKGRPDGAEARIYRFDSDGMPQLDRDLTAAVNKNVTVLSLSGIAHYIREGSDRKAFGDRMEAFAAEVAEADPESYNKFALIYVNDDRFPELLELGTSECKGAKIVFYKDGVLEEAKVSSDFSYLNKANLLYSRSGTDNLFTEGIYVYTGNGFDVYQSGTYGTMDAAVTAYTKARKPEYTYKWEGSVVSEAGYNDAKGFIYDAQKALDPGKITMLGAEDFLQELKK